MKRKREKIGPFLITTNENLCEQGIVCSNCSKLLSKYSIEKDDHEPPPDELMKNGAVPIPNFGWFCSQKCGSEYEKEFSVTFERNEKGLISYYDE